MLLKISYRFSGLLRLHWVNYAESMISKQPLSRLVEEEGWHKSIELPSETHNFLTSYFYQVSYLCRVNTGLPDSKLNKYI